MSSEMKITVPLAIILTAVGILVTFFGWVTNKTLNDINANLTNLGVKIENLIEVRYDHETRLKILESERNKKDDHPINKTNKK